jgi:hypothetical protein
MTGLGIVEIYQGSIGVGESMDIENTSWIRSEKSVFVDKNVLKG